MRNKYIAAGFGILGGIIGLHKFYLGRWFQGIIYILLACTVVFSWIPMLLGFFEGILYLINKQEWFDIKYNIKYMKEQDYINNRE